MRVTHIRMAIWSPLGISLACRSCHRGVGGILTSPSPLQLFAFEAPNELITAFPLVLVPVFLVPVSVLLHLASLTKLHRDALRDHDHKEIVHSPA
jgi:hypothetical protein